MSMPPPPPPPGFPGAAPPPPEPAPFVPMAPIAPSSKKSNKTVLIVVGAVVAAAVVAGGAFLLLGGDDDGKLDTADAVRNVSDIVDAARLNDDTGSAELDECPIIELDDLADLAPSAFDAVEIAKGDQQANVTLTADRKDPRLVQCFVFTDDGDDDFGIYAGEAPEGDFQDYTERVYETFDLDFEKSVGFQGGTIESYTGTPDDDDGSIDFAESDWSDGKLQVGIFASGDGATPQLTTEWLKKVLPQVVKNLDGLDPDDFPASGS